MRLDAARLTVIIGIPLGAQRVCVVGVSTRDGKSFLVSVHGLPDDIETTAKQQARQHVLEPVSWSHSGEGF